MKIVDENVLNGTVILILITCMVASFVEFNAGTRLAVAEADAKPDLDAAPEKSFCPFLLLRGPRGCSTSRS